MIGSNVHICPVCKQAVKEGQEMVMECYHIGCYEKLQDSGKNDFLAIDVRIYVYTTKSSILRHMKRMHGVKRQRLEHHLYSCKFCKKPKPTKKRSNVENHIKSQNLKNSTLFHNSLNETVEDFLLRTPIERKNRASYQMRRNQWQNEKSS